MLELLSGIGVAAEVVVGRRVLEAILVAKAEHELFARIGELFAGRSVLLISHRFSTVRSADRIYVLNEGRLVEAGTHAELLARGGTYAELFTLQASPYQ